LGGKQKETNGLGAPTITISLAVLLCSNLILANPWSRYY
jgi:hypothetical protein